MNDILRMIERVAPSEIGVLIVGEIGSGKDWTAHMIHGKSRRSRGRFIHFDCTSFSHENIERELFGSETSTTNGIEKREGAFEVANGGTIFLDEISALPQVLQKKLARAFKERRFRPIGGRTDIPLDIRFLASLDRHPDGTVNDSMLRHELYSQISPVIINLPPLREYRNGIPSLIKQFLSELSGRHSKKVLGITPEAVRLCVNYDWPGNVRQLKNAIEYASLMSQGSVISHEHLPLYVLESHHKALTSIHLGGKMNLASIEKIMIEQTLKKTRTKKEAAQRLGISLKTLYNKILRYNLDHSFGQDSFVKGVRASNRKSMKKLDSMESFLPDYDANVTLSMSSQGSVDRHFRGKKS